MQQSLGSIDYTLSFHLCRLHKYLCGLKQAPRVLYTLLSDYCKDIKGPSFATC
jgi:hypothetical protein